MGKDPDVKRKEPFIICTHLFSSYILIWVPEFVYFLVVFEQKLSESIGKDLTSS
jgi:hypothetical protein